MSEHDPLCPFHALSQKPTGIAMSSCQCWLIDRVRESMKPECTCGNDNLSYVFHLVPCKQGAFLMSQDKTERMYLDNDG